MNYDNANQHLRSSLRTTSRLPQGKMGLVVHSFIYLFSTAVYLCNHPHVSLQRYIFLIHLPKLSVLGKLSHPSTKPL